jgi:cellulose synthase/poly-beta-1,6-N-acetylglucosamine synthase-like glycosyltransferase
MNLMIDVLRVYWIFCLMTVSTSYGYAVYNKREVEISCSTSIVIPCHHLHAKYLKRVCQAYCNQTVLPDEIVISLSGYLQIEEEIIKDLEETPWPFPVRLILTEESKKCCENRNIAAGAAECDILILQDADDFPHPQRVEIISYFFNNYDIVHLMHSVQKNDNRFVPQSDFSELDHFYLSGIRFLFKNYGDKSLGCGVNAVLKTVHNQTKWVEYDLFGTDVKFCARVMKKYKKTMGLGCSLYLYNFHVDSIFFNHFREEKDGEITYNFF